MTLAVSQAFHDAQLVGGLQAFLESTGDVSAENATLELYGTTQPDPGVVTGDIPLVVIVLAVPCTTFVDHRLRLVQAEPAGDLILTQGDLVWGRLRTANGTWACDGSASDTAGEGDFKVSGTDGVLLYAGARALLGVTRFG
jgi:hypothetical protein